MAVGAAVSLDKAHQHVISDPGQAKPVQEPDCSQGILMIPVFAPY
jgi:hypothetical protein